LKQLFLFVALVFITHGGYAQSILNKTVSVNVTRQPLSSVLDNIARQGDFHFSYIKDFIRDDSLVSVKATNKPVRQILDLIFQGSCQYKEIGNQLILQRIGKEKWYFVSGYITDAVTGKPVSNASIYERMQLISTMTNDMGYFRIRLKEKEQLTALTVSKDLYKDTAMIISSGFDQEMKASIKPAGPIMLSVVDVNQFTHVEQTWLGHFFLSSRQRVQSLNLSDFFTKQPYQYSLIPSLGTHGKMGSQVVNKVSLNMIGGYTAGLNGVEWGGVFNIDQKDVKYVQVAGWFNIVGGKMTGVQLAGLHNNVLDSLKGFQASGISNVLKSSFEGVQMAGIINHAKGKGEGVQAAGIGNIAEDSILGWQAAGIFDYAGDVKGLQTAGIMNIARGSVQGVQAAGIVNYAKTLHGVQIGIVNIADSSDGYSIGLFNFVKSGYRQIVVYNDEMLDLNIAFKSGNHKLYTILTAGMSLNSNEKAYGFGLGLGHIFPISKRISIQAEYVSEAVYLGSWEYTESINRFQPLLNVKFGHITLFAGPAFTISSREQGGVPVKGYKAALPGRYNAGKMGDNVTHWLGWHVGVGF
jgi:hypothetical protein